MKTCTNLNCSSERTIKICLENPLNILIGCILKSERTRMNSVLSCLRYRHLKDDEDF